MKRGDLPVSRRQVSIFLKAVAGFGDVPHMWCAGSADSLVTDSLAAHYVEPNQVYATHKFLNKVVLLTNDQVGSAGELFVMAMKQLPTVSTVGMS